jgi:hypothetical protein
MPVRIARRWGALLERAPWLDIEFWSAASAVGWAGMSLVMPGDLTDRPSWVWLGQVLSPPWWEFAGVLLGAAQGAALFHLAPLQRWVAAFAASCFWLLLMTSIIVADHAAPSIILYLAFGAANLVAMGRAAATASEAR